MLASVIRIYHDARSSECQITLSTISFVGLRQITTTFNHNSRCPDQDANWLSPEYRTILLAAPSQSISRFKLQKPSCLYEAKGHKNHCPRQEEIYGTGGTDPLILKLGTKWKLFMSFTPWPLNTRGKRLGALNRSGPLGKKKISCHSRELNHDSAVFQLVV